MTANIERNEEQTETTRQYNRVSGFVGETQVFKSNDGECLIHKLPGNMRIQLHVNFYKKILGADYTPKEPMQRDQSIPKAWTFGLIAQPEVYMSSDKKDLVHKVLGVRVVKPVNYYKKILGIQAVDASSVTL